VSGRWTRRDRIVAAVWVLVIAVVWNGLYDVILLGRTRRYLYEQALYQAGRGPAVDLPQAMADGVRDAVWLASLWSGLLLLVVALTFFSRRTARTS
jgi:hypothetical protein